jgi:hypothetical protein
VAKTSNSEDTKEMVNRFMVSNLQLLRDVEPIPKFVPSFSCKRHLTFHLPIEALPVSPLQNKMIYLLLMV